MRLTDLQTVQRMQLQVHSLIETAGMQVTWKRFKSRSDGKPEYGIGDILNYDFKPITVIIISPQLPQTQREAGQIVEGGLNMMSVEKLTNQDEIIWMDSTYRVDSEVTPVVLGGTLYYQYKLSRAN